MIVLDHIAFGVSDRRAAANAMECLGFATSEPSRCTWEIAGEHVSADAICCVFEQQYFDFIEIADPKWTAHLASSAIYGRGMAPTGIVVSGLSPDDAFAKLENSTGRAPSPPYPIARSAPTSPPLDIAYRFLAVQSAGFALGLIEDSAPAALRRPAWLAHPNTAIGIVAVDVRVPAPEETIAALARPPLLLATATGDARGEVGAPEVQVGAARLRFHREPRDPYLAAVSERLLVRDRPMILAVEVEVRSLDHVADGLRARAVEFAEGDKRLEVDPDAGFGAGWMFRESQGFDQ